MTKYLWALALLFVAGPALADNQPTYQTCSITTAPNGDTYYSGCTAAEGGDVPAEHSFRDNASHS